MGVARLELTELVGRVAWLSYLFEPAAGGRGVAETVGESTRASSSTANRRPGWPPRSVQVSTTTFPCALHCPAWRLADVFDACGRPRVQEMVSEDSWHLFFVRCASTPWSSFGRRGWSMSAMRERGGLRMPGMSAGDLCGGRADSCMPCASWRAQALANVTVGFRGVLLAFVNLSFLSCRHVV